MKRDMDMVRAMMIELGNAAGPISSEQLLSDHEDRGLVHYHAWLIHDAGLVEGTVAEAETRASPRQSYPWATPLMQLQMLGVATPMGT